MRYELFYWPSIPGRGEFIRLALEQAAVQYIDVARAGNKGMAAMMRVLDSTIERAPFAPPFLKAGSEIIGQTANILLFLGDKHGLAPADEAGRRWAHQLQLTIADFLVEIHDIHHPIASALYYEDQKPEAKRRAAIFHKERLPKFLGYFENVLKRNSRGARFLVGGKVSYVDLSVFQVMAGLHYAFPRAMATAKRRYPLLHALAARVATLPRIAAYLASERRMDFNRQGIFRHYPELDAPVRKKSAARHAKKK
jgi:glutathione S-transferase